MHVHYHITDGKKILAKLDAILALLTPAAPGKLSAADQAAVNATFDQATADSAKLDAVMPKPAT